MLTYSIKDKIYGLIEQSTWGTVVSDDGTTNSPASTVTEVDCEPFNIDMDVRVRQQVGSHGTRSMTYNDMQTDEKGSIPKFSVTQDVKWDDIDLILSAYFQNVTEAGASAPYSKTFSLPSTQPDFNTSAGYFYTWFEYHPAASTTWKVYDAIVESLTISASPGERVKVKSDWQCNKSGITTGNPTAASVFTRPALEYHYFEEVDRVTINIAAGGAQNMTLVGDIEFAMKQELTPVGHDGSGNPQTFAIGSRTGTFKMTINKDAVAYACIAAWKAGSTVDINWGFGNATPGTVDGDFDVQCYGKIEKVEIDTNNVLGAIVTGQILAPDSSTSAITIVCANGVDRNW